MVTFEGTERLTLDEALWKEELMPSTVSRARRGYISPAQVIKNYNVARKLPTTHKGIMVME